MITITVEGKITKIYYDGKYDGQIEKISSGYRWENLLKYSGECKTEKEAFVHLGYKFK
jgi:hypothetical protein